MIDIRPIIIVLYIFLGICFYCKQTLLVKKIIPYKVMFYMEKFRLFLWWGLFLQMSPDSIDIIITSHTDKNIYQWSLRKDKQICNIYLQSDISRLILTFYYSMYFSFFLNSYLYNHIKEYLKNKQENMILFTIEQKYFNSYTLKKNNNFSKILFIMDQ